MAKTITIYESLSFDTEVKTHATKADAIAYVVKVLTKEGDWPLAEAQKIAASGRQALVRDNGDDELIHCQF